MKYIYFHCCIGGKIQGKFYSTLQLIFNISVGRNTLKCFCCYGLLGHNCTVCDYFWRSGFVANSCVC